MFPNCPPTPPTYYSQRPSFSERGKHKTVLRPGPTAEAMSHEVANQPSAGREARHWHVSRRVRIHAQGRPHHRLKSRKRGSHPIGTSAARCASECRPAMPEDDNTCRCEVFVTDYIPHNHFLAVARLALHAFARLYGCVVVRDVIGGTVFAVECDVFELDLQCLENSTPDCKPGCRWRVILHYGLRDERTGPSKTEMKF
ncbi:hypothetical protein PAXINDRAFT_173433 [Paxillus involutus ATCC 200175]|uniref:Uncharacterized protein n=1 Tax=Paxillus involutus ATCC 200175 TaxID=664439 RepID=A0A0C9TI14_PAXIN|nr:hypothetical protein PAXINDRAFT_173433 [Paxillus involutus ATCC 200175]